MAEHEQQCNVESSSNSTFPLVVRSYFTDIIRDDGNFIEALCSLCKPKKNIIHGQHKAPSNFTKHIQVQCKKGKTFSKYSFRCSTLTFYHPNKSMFSVGRLDAPRSGTALNLNLHQIISILN
jgi:hypothetical protein